jgi:hypothetical protein
MSEPRLDLEHVEVDVEPLGDPRWTRIERGMFAKLERPPATGLAARLGGRRVWIAGGCVLAAAAAAMVIARPSVGARSRDPVRLVTTGSPSRFTIGESSLWIEPSSLVLVSGDDEHGVDVVLDRGTVTCEVAPRRGRPPFVVDAGEVRVQVVGTRFTVTRGPGETSVGVDHGVVDVAVGGVVTVLHDGERWPASSASGSGVAPGGMGGMDRTAAAPGGGEAAPDRSSSAGPAVVGPSITAVSPTGASPGEVSSTGIPTDIPVAAPHAASIARRAVGSSASPGVPPAASAPSTVAPSSAGAPASSPQQVFESAARIERTRPDDAAALYRQLVSGGTAWAGSALFALGRLEADRGRRPEATRLLEEYLARYPRGINGDDARALLQRMQ